MYRVDGKTGAITAAAGRGVHVRLLRVGDGRSASGCSSRAAATTGPGSSTPSGLRVTRSWPVGDLRRGVSPTGDVFALASQAGRVRLLDLRLRADAHAPRPPRRRRPPDAVHTRRADARDLGRATGACFAWDVETRSHRAALRWAHRRDRGARPHRRRAHASHRGRRCGARSSGTWRGDRRLDRRFAVGRRFDAFVTAEGHRDQPGRAHARPHAQRRGGRPDRHPDAAAARERARARRHRRRSRLQPGRAPARGDRRRRDASPCGTREPWRRRASSRDASRLPGAGLLTRRQAARRGGGRSPGHGGRCGCGTCAGGRSPASGAGRRPT